MNRNIKFLAFLLIPVVLSFSTLPLTWAHEDSTGVTNAITPRRNLAFQGGSPVLVRGAKPYRQDVEKALKRYDSLELDPQLIQEQVRENGGFVLPTSDGAFDLRLTLHDMRSPRYKAQASGDGGQVRELERGPVFTYKGIVSGMANAQARFTIDGSRVEGLIITPSRLYFVEPANHFSTLAGRNDFVVYRDSDLASSLGDCGLTLAGKVGAEAARFESEVTVNSVNGPGAEEVFSPPRVVDLATEADFEYFQANGSNVNTTNNEIISIMNQVEGIYDTQIGLQFTIVFQNVWDVVGDPYTPTAASAALDEFRSVWASTRSSVQRDLAHMWTGKDFDTMTIGIAFRPGLDCPFDPLGFGYGISQRITFPALGKFILTAHEIGHNFNAQHSDAQPDCTNSIMNASLGSSTTQTFCPFSVNQIEAHASAEAACLPQGINPACNYSLSPTSQSLPLGGGNGSVNVNTVGSNCIWGATSTVGWITINSGSSGTGNGTVNFSVAANSGFARNGVLRIAEQNATVSQPGSPGCAINPIGFGQTINAALSGSDCPSSQRQGSFADQYSFTGTAGQQVRIDMSSSAIDTYLYLFGPNGNIVAENDDIDLVVNTNSRIPLNGFFTLPTTGTYIIESTSFDTNETGSYSLTLTANSPVSSVSFSGNTVVSEGVDGNGIGFEGTGFTTVTVQRSGDLSGPSSVDYATSNLSADSRKDYAQVAGTIQFASGESSKTFVVFVVDDVFQESPEIINLTLSNPVGTTLGATPTATVTINSNDISTGLNPVDPNSFNTRFFVRQHYQDFFTREPDLPGMAFWSNQIDECTNEPCREIRRINVSGAFYVSIEFQQTGYLVYKTFAAAFGRTRIGATVPLTLNEFVPDVQRIGKGVIIGQPGADALLEANKQAYFGEYVVRSSFTSQYPTSLSPAQFVDTLFSNAAVTPSAADRTAAISEFGGQPNTADNAARGRALRRVAENSILQQQEFNRAFVLMQYFGYLRRNPNDPPEATLDFQGFNFWLNKLIQFNGNFVNAEMVKSFLVSGEFKQRFGP